MARVFLENVTKHFGVEHALRGLTLEILDGEFFVLLGPSGCGKTTALRIVAGLEEASGGSVYIGEQRVNEIPAKDRDVAMVFQSYALYPHMSVYDNMAFGLRMRKFGRDEIDSRVRSAASALGIDTLLQRRPGELSGGQQQRVALGRAIVRQPRAYLMDEPLSNLDAKMRVQMRAELVRLHREVGTTFIYVTHDQVEAMTMGGRIAVLEKGLLQQVGAPQEVYDRPANRFVAEFIGSPAMNFIDAQVERVDGAVLLRNDIATFSLPPTLAAAIEAAESQSLVVGIRPEHLAPEDGAASGVAAQFEGKVDLVESLGSEEHVVVTMASGTLVVRLPASARLEIGAQLRLGVRPEHLHLFDRASGGRIDA